MQKIPLIILMLLLSITGFSNAQNDSIVKVNRVKYQQIRNNRESFETAKVDLTGESSVNTHATAYYDGNDLKIIEVIYLAETGHRQIEYYFENGILFFALERNQPPDEIIVINKNSKNGKADNGTVTENRYYYYNDKLIRWYDNVKKEVDITSEKNLITGQGLLAEAYKLKEKLKK